VRASRFSLNRKKFVKKADLDKNSGKAFDSFSNLSKELLKEKKSFKAKRETGGKN
jgi:hypothetical protein